MEDLDDLDILVRDALAAWKKLDVTDVRILEGITHLGPRNLSQVARDIGLPSTTVRYRVNRMHEDSLLFLLLIPNTANLGLKRAVVFIEAAPGYETNLMDYMKINDFWVFLCSIYGRFEGCAGIWTIPHDRTREFHSFLQELKDTGVAKKFEVSWTTSFHNISVSSRWFNTKEETWTFNWNEWIDEVETIEGELPPILSEPKLWPIKADHTDLLIIKELEKDARWTLQEISEILEIPLSTIKYHFYEHITKQGLIGGYQVEIYLFPFPLCEILFFKFEFDDTDKMRRFALSMMDKPIAINIGKVLGEDTLISHVFLPKWQLRRFTRALSTLEKRGCLRSYYYYIQDMYQTWRETIPYEHFKDGKWIYDHDRHIDDIKKMYDKDNR